jgi:hypothetical protein
LSAPQRRGPTPFELDRLKKAGLRDPQASSPVVTGANALAPEPMGQIDWRERILAGLEALGLTFTIDAMRHSEVEANGNEVTVTLPAEFKLMADPEELQKAVRQQGLGPVRFKLVFGDAGAPAPVGAPAQKPPAKLQDVDEVTERALAHPEVRRFREVFGGEVRGVRNLKE